MADFPQKNNQSASIKKQNSELSKKYGVRGFPTVLLLDNNGEVIYKTGYRSGGAESYIKDLEDKLNPKQKVDPPPRRMFGG